MKILVTGAKGFVGKNLVAELENIKYGKDKTYPLTQDIEIYEYDIDTDKSMLSEFCKDCDFVFNLAGVNRPETESESIIGPVENVKRNGSATAFPRKSFSPLAIVTV